MQILIVISYLLAAASAGDLGPAGYAAPAYGAAAAVVQPHIAHSQFRAQDSAGQYNYGFSSTDGIHRTETRGLDGSVIGSYSYVSPEGQHIKIGYTGGAAGFNVGGSGLPLPVGDTPEVAAAKSAHYAAHADAAVRAAANPDPYDGYAGYGAGYAAPFDAGYAAPYGAGGVVKYH